MKVDHEAKQVAALEALFGSVRPARPLDELAQAFLLPIISRDGFAAFSGSQVLRTVEDVKAGQPETTADQAGVLMAVIRALAEHRSMPFSELASQILWRNRKAKALQHTAFRRLARELSWLGSSDDKDPLEPVEEVFGRLTAACGGRMAGRQWQKVVGLIQRNPVLNSHMKLRDADRLFYAECRRSGDANSSIGMSEFKELLFELAECSGINPCLIFICVGSHTRRLRAEAEEAEEASSARPSVKQLTAPAVLLQQAFRSTQ